MSDKSALTYEERLAIRRASEDALEAEKRKIDEEAEERRIENDRNSYMRRTGRKEMKP